MKKQRGINSSSLHIPHDIMVQVLAKCPAKSLMKFKCVCKLWQSTICDPQFAKLHKFSSQTRWDGNYLVRFWLHCRKLFISFKVHDQGEEEGAVPAGDIELELIKFHKYPITCNVSISKPLDGLVCIYFHNTSDALVLNISTRQIVHLPESCLDQDKIHSKYACHALGFDPMTNEYKVLSFYTSYDSRFLGKICEIYTLGTTSRRKINMPRLPSCSSRRITPCINGTIYFTTKEESRLIAFDVGKEIFCTLTTTAPLHLKIPFAINGGDLELAREFFGTDLVLSNRAFDDGRGDDHPIDGQLFELAFLEEDDKHQLLLRKTIAFSPNMRSTKGLHMSGISPTGEIIMVDDQSSRMVYLDLETKTWDEIHLEWPHPKKNQYLLFRKVCYNHVENIIRLKDDPNCVPHHNELFH